MNFFLNNTLMALVFLVSQVNYSQNTITPDDLQIIFGEWKGTLTYIDYGTNKPFTMPANVTVEAGKNEYQIQLLINYPKEPNANSKDKIKISKDGLLINKNKIQSRQKLADEDIEIITEYYGKDNNKKALIRNIYLLGHKRFIIRKEVKFNDSENWVMRNEYKFLK